MGTHNCDRCFALWNTDCDRTEQHHSSATTALTQSQPASLGHQRLSPRMSFWRPEHHHDDVQLIDQSAIQQSSSSTTPSKTSQQPHLPRKGAALFMKRKCRGSLKTIAWRSESLPSRERRGGGIEIAVCLSFNAWNHPKYVSISPAFRRDRDVVFVGTLSS